MKKKIYLGIDIGGTNIKLAWVDSNGAVLKRGLLDTEAGLGARDALRRIRSALTSLVDAKTQVTAAGIGCAGLVDAKRGILVTSPNLPKWNNAPLRRIAEEELGVQVYIDNDVNAAAFGEYMCGCGKGRSHLICITLGTGVGGGIVTGGRLLSGSANFAGEIGHMSVDMNGPLCKCGNRGCLEAFIGKNALVRSAKAKLEHKSGRILGRLTEREKRALTPKIIFHAAERGDRVAKEVFHEAAGYLGTAIASMINIFNPEVIALGGGISGAFGLMQPRLQKVVEARAFKEPAAMVTICRSALGNDSSTVGAALIAKERGRSRRKDAC
ncbi:MAG: ROK family protein [Candidatus Latescibacterota bacterium]